jgi:hypothetical protein
MKSTKLIQATEYFITAARRQQSELNEQIVAKLELGQTNEEFQTLFARRQQLKSVQEGLEHLQWHLGKLKTVKAFDRSHAAKLSVPLQKELAHLWFEMEEPLCSILQEARDFIKSEMTADHGNVGLSIFDTIESDETKHDMTVVEGDGGLFDWKNPRHAPELAPTS